MAQIEYSEGASDPRIRELVIREDISLADSSGVHVGSTEIPLGVKIDAMHISVNTAISGGSVYTLDFGFSNDASVYFPCGSTRVLTAGASLFEVFEYGRVNLFPAQGPDPGRRFLGGGDSSHSAEYSEATTFVRTISAGTFTSANTSRIVLFTKALDGEPASTTAGSVRVTVYGTRYIF